MYTKSLFYSAIMANIGLTSAAPAVESSTIDKRGGGPGILDDIIGSAILGWSMANKNAGYDPCPTWAHILGDAYYIARQSDNGNVIATACFSNSTTLDHGGELMEFTTQDRDTANCLNGLHVAQSDTCISTAGSSCDIDDYSGNGGHVVNARMGTYGLGSADYQVLTEDQANAANNAFNALVGVQMYKGGAMPQVFFFDAHAVNPNVAMFPDYSLNIAGDTCNYC